MFNVNGDTIKFAKIESILDFDRRINRYGHRLWNYTPKEYKNESLEIL